MVGLIEDTDYITTQDFKEAGDLIYLVGETKQEFCGSELQKLIHGKIFGQSPELDLEKERNVLGQISKAIRANTVASAHDVSEGGVAVALAEPLFNGKGLGAEVTLSGDATAALFSESQTRFILSVKKENQQAFEQLVDAVCIGEVTNTDKLVVKNENGESLIDASVEELKDAWKGAIPCLLKSRD